MGGESSQSELLPNASAAAKGYRGCARSRLIAMLDRREDGASETAEGGWKGQSWSWLESCWDGGEGM